MSLIKGMTVQLHVRTQTGTDAFNRPVYTDSVEAVENVIVSPVSTADAADALNLTGRTIAYELCIPKGDAHIWDNATVDFFGQTWRTVGFPQEFIADMLPLGWNKKIKVERYE